MDYTSLLSQSGESLVAGSKINFLVVNSGNYGILFTPEFVKGKKLKKSEANNLRVFIRRHKHYKCLLSSQEVIVFGGAYEL